MFRYGTLAVQRPDPSPARGALGCRLEKSGHYVLGEGMPPPGPADVRSAVHLAAVASALVAAAALLLAARADG